MKKLLILLTLLIGINLSSQDINNYVNVNFITVDTVDNQIYHSYYFEYDVITVVRNDCDSDFGYNYLIYSEISTHPIGYFDEGDTEHLLYWIDQYPIGKDDLNSSNYYYQQIVEQKIWE